MCYFIFSRTDSCGGGKSLELFHPPPTGEERRLTDPPRTAAAPKKKKLVRVACANMGQVIMQLFGMPGWWVSCLVFAGRVRERAEAFRHFVVNSTGAGRALQLCKVVASSSSFSSSPKREPGEWG